MVSTFKNIIKKASVVLGHDYVDDSQQILGFSNETSQNWVNLFLLAISEIQGEIRNENIIFNTIILNVTGQLIITPTPSFNQNTTNLYEYPLDNLPGFNIYKVYKQKKEQKKADSILCLDNNSYIEEESRLIASFNGVLTVERLDDRIYKGSSGSLSNVLQEDTDIVLLDELLLIYKICCLYGGIKGNPSLPFYLQKYQERFDFCAEKSRYNKKFISLI